VYRRNISKFRRTGPM